MTKGQNMNHPKAGSTIKVEPIKDLKDIKTIKTLLADKPRDLALFTLGINTNLRASDLRRITAGMIRTIEKTEYCTVPVIAQEIELKEKKTGKTRRITLNDTVQVALQGLLATRPYADDEPIFSGRDGTALTVPSIHRLVKSWCRAINLAGNYGSHTLRKTWGYHQRVTFGVDLPVLMVCFNHATPRQTLNYLCIQPEELRDVYENEL
jgi:integrase